LQISAALPFTASKPDQLVSGFARLIANAPVLDHFESAPEVRVFPSTAFTQP
jgi:hypothetical protein